MGILRLHMEDIRGPCMVYVRNQYNTLTCDGREMFRLVPQSTAAHRDT